MEPAVSVDGLRSLFRFVQIADHVLGPSDTDFSAFVKPKFGTRINVHNLEKKSQVYGFTTCIMGILW